MDRRRFLVGAAGAMAAGVIPGRFAGAGRLVAAPGSRPHGGGAGRAGRSLRILILGGTGFIGPHQVKAALDRGHTLTLFNRGRTNPGLFPDLETLLGDRDGDLESLRNREWDCVIDNSGFEPEQVALSAGLLRDAVRQYLFVSTQSVYSDRSIIDQDETGHIGRAGVPEQEWSGYGPLKALCEKELTDAMPGRATIVRPAVIVGPGDSSDRFTYWVQRVDRGGEVLAPGQPEDPTQFIDVRDLCEWLIRLVDNETMGVFNATGPLAPLSVGEFVHGLRAVTSSAVSFTWTSHAFLREQAVRHFSELPLWQFPDGATAGFLRMSAARAQAAGLTYRPLAVTAGETLDWWRSEPEERRTGRLRAGLTPEREAAILAAWKTRAAG
jgi:2'-hydroxyisoflavone reductase